MNNPWQRRRSVLNHDWLKNGYMKGVDAFVSRLGRQSPVQLRIQEFLISDFPVWRRRQPKLQALLADAVDALSPRSLFDLPPLSLCGPETLAWLPNLAHSLWLARYPIKEQVENSQRALKRADAAYNHIVKGLNGSTASTDPTRLRECEPLFREFSKALHALSAAISALPKKVMVV